MAFTTTQPNFNGTAAAVFIHAALKTVKSLDFMTMIENVKYKTNIQNFNGATGLVTDAACTYSSAGNLDLGETTITPKNLKLNLDICRETLLDSWESLNMRAGSSSMASPSFEEHVISYLGEIIADNTEGSIWSGTAAGAGKFNGFLGAATGELLPGVDATVIQDAAAGAYTATNIIGELGNLVAAVPAAVYVKEDLYIYMSPKTWRLYIEAISALSGFPFANMSDDYTKMYNGIKIAMCPGMEDNQMVAAQKSNMFFATDLISDQVAIQLLDMTNVTGDDTIRCVAKFSGGVRQGIGADVVRQS